MGELIQSKCGIVVARTLHDAHSMIDDLKHRGPDMTGIAAIGDTIDVVKWLGKPNTFEVRDLESILKGTNYHTFLAHCRYKTAGGDALSNAHPQTIGGIRYDNGSHFVVRDCDAVMVHNGQVALEYMADIPSEVLKTQCDTEQLLRYVLKHGPDKTLTNIPAAYTLAYATKQNPNVTVLRDKTGIRPGWIFTKDGKEGMASEDQAIAKNGARKIEEIDRGSKTIFYPKGHSQTLDVVDPKETYCFFELAYLLNPLSHFVGTEAHHARRRFGKYLAQQMMQDDQIPPGALVTYLPRCSEPMAQKFAEEAELEFVKMFYKMRSDRSFQQSTQEKRQESINNNLHMLPEWYAKAKDRPIIIVDDSIVRGTNLQRPRDLLLEHGVDKKNITLASAVPPIGILDEQNNPRGCLWGVDMPPNITEVDPITKKRKEYIARGKTIDQISRKTGINIVYSSLDTFNEVFRDIGIHPDRLCSYCIGGRAPHPVPITINQTS